MAALSSSNWLVNLPLKTSKSTQVQKTKCPSYPIITANKKVRKIRQIILTKDIPMLGKEGELVSVRAGYYRNFLAPRGDAKRATPDYLKEIALAQERIEAEKKRVKEEYRALALLLETSGDFTVKCKGGKGKQIFGSVTTQDVAGIINAQLGRDIDKRIINIPEIREVGLYVAEINLHPEVTARIRLIVTAN